MQFFWLRWGFFSFCFEYWFAIFLIEIGIFFTTVGSLFLMLIWNSFELICLVWYRSLNLSQSPQMSCFDEMIAGTLFLVSCMELFSVLSHAWNFFLFYLKHGRVSSTFCPPPPGPAADQEGWKYWGPCSSQDHNQVLKQ